jgi:hypothetical protein
MMTIAVHGEAATEVATMVKPDGGVLVMDARVTEGESMKDHHANADQNMVEACTARGAAIVIASVPMEVVAVIPSGGSLVHTVGHADLITVARVAAMTTIAEIVSRVRVVDTARDAARGTRAVVGAMKRVAGVIREGAVSMASRWGTGRTGGVRHLVDGEREGVVGMVSYRVVVPATIVTNVPAATMAVMVNARV